MSSISVRMVPSRHGPAVLRMAAVAALAFPAGLAGARVAQHYGAPTAPMYSHVSVQHTLAALPLAFEPNVGQTDAQAAYVARGNGYTAFATHQGVVFSLQMPGQTRHAGQPQRNVAFRLALQGADPAATISASGLMPGKTNYLLGRDRQGWRTGVAHYSVVRYGGVYPGIDMRLYGTGSSLEYSFDLAPGADASRIALRFQGVQGFRLDGHGGLLLRLPGGTVPESAPVVYQQGPHGRVAVSGHYVLRRDGGVGFALGTYDHARSLTIDPVLSYSTFLSGTNFDAVQAVAAGSAAPGVSGNIYVTGQAASLDFPVTPGAFQTVNNNIIVEPTFIIVNPAAFVSEINPTLSGAASLVYSTYVGGQTVNPALPATQVSVEDIGFGIAVDAAGDAYITGGTQSSSFPTTAGAFQTRHKDILANGVTGFNAFVTELNPTGTALIYSTFLGGSDPLGNGDTGFGIALDSAGNAYVTGSAFSNDFPTTAGAVQTTNKAFANNGPNVFVTKVLAGGTALGYSTYLGGSTAAGGRGIAVDSAGNAYVTGQTFDSDFKVTAGAFQATNRAFANNQSNAFVTKLGGTGALVYSTYLGGTDTVGNGDAGLGIAVDSVGQAYVTGQASSTDFPLASPFQGVQKDAAAGGTNAFVSKLTAAGSGLMYSTYVGGSDPVGNGDAGLGIAVDGLGDAYITGYTDSTDYPTANAMNLQPVHATFTASSVKSQAVKSGKATVIRRLVVRPHASAGIRPAAQPSFTSDAFVTKLNPTGTKLAWSTFLGGSGTDVGQGIAIDALANVDVGGVTLSGNFPVTPNAFQTTDIATSFAGFVSQLAVSYCQAQVTFIRSGANRLGLAYNIGAPTHMHNIEYITLQLGANQLVVRGLLGATCNVGKGPATFIFTGTVSSGYGIFQPGDAVTLTLTVGPPGGPAPTAVVTVTRGTPPVVILPPTTLTGGFGSSVNVGTF